MKCVLQRVSEASVRVDGEVVGEIGAGLLVFVCVMRGDTAAEGRALAHKIAHWRCFADAHGRMNVSALAGGFALLVVSQFTLAADGDRGRRPSFDKAAAPEVAQELYAAFVEELRALALVVETGRFAAHMDVLIRNDGPVTFVLESAPPTDPLPRRGERSQVLA